MHYTERIKRIKAEEDCFINIIIVNIKNPKDGTKNTVSLKKGSKPVQYFRLIFAREWESGHEFYIVLKTLTEFLRLFSVVTRGQQVVGGMFQMLEPEYQSLIFETSVVLKSDISLWPTKHDSSQAALNLPDHEANLSAVKKMSTFLTLTSPVFLKSQLIQGCSRDFCNGAHEARTNTICPGEGGGSLERNKGHIFKSLIKLEPTAESYFDICSVSLAKYFVDESYLKVLLSFHFFIENYMLLELF